MHSYYTQTFMQHKLHLHKLNKRTQINFNRKAISIHIDFDFQNCRLSKKSSILTV